MHIEIRADIQAPVGIPVGLLDGMPLVYQGRVLYVGGAQCRQAEIAPALFEAIDRAACQVWGGEWNSDFARVLGLNRRTVTRDRIEKYGLPAWTLAILGRAAAHPTPRALGLMMLAATEFDAILADVDHRGLPAVERHRDTGDVAVQPHDVLRYAILLVSFARVEREKHRAAKASHLNDVNHAA